MMVLCLFLILTLGAVHPAPAKVLPPTGRKFSNKNACVTLPAYISGYPCTFTPSLHHDLYNCIFNLDPSLLPTFIHLNCGTHNIPPNSAPSPSPFFQTRFLFKTPCQVTIYSHKASSSTLLFTRLINHFLPLITHPLNPRFSAFSDPQKSPSILHHKKLSWCFPRTASLKTQLATQNNTPTQFIMSFVWSAPSKKRTVPPLTTARPPKKQRQAQRNSGNKTRLTEEEKSPCKEFDAIKLASVNIDLFNFHAYIRPPFNANNRYMPNNLHRYALKHQEDPEHAEHALKFCLYTATNKVS